MLKALPTRLRILLPEVASLPIRKNVAEIKAYCCRIPPSDGAILGDSGLNYRSSNRPIILNDQKSSPEVRHSKHLEHGLKVPATLKVEEPESQNLRTFASGSDRT